MWSVPANRVAETENTRQLMRNPDREPANEGPPKRTENHPPSRDYKPTTRSRAHLHVAREDRSDEKTELANKR